MKRDRRQSEARIDTGLGPGSHDLDGDEQHDQPDDQQPDPHEQTDDHDACHVRPISLRNRNTGEREAVVSLEALRDSAGDLSEMSVCFPTTRLDLDWPALLKLAGFTDEEAVLVIASRIEQTPRTKLAKALGWKSRKVETVRKRVARKLAARKRGKIRQAEPLNLPVIVRSDPSRAANQLRFHSGVTCWELGPVKTE